MGTMSLRYWSRYKMMCGKISRTITRVDFGMRLGCGVVKISPGFRQKSIRSPYPQSELNRVPSLVVYRY